MFEAIKKTLYPSGKFAVSHANVHTLTFPYAAMSDEAFEAREKAAKRKREQRLRALDPVAWAQKEQLEKELKKAKLVEEAEERAKENKLKAEKRIALEREEAAERMRLLRFTRHEDFSSKEV